MGRKRDACTTSAADTIVTPLELPYERTLYEGPVYPGTLTYQGTVPNIKLVRHVSGTAIRKGSREIVDINNSSSMTLFDDLVHGAGRGYGKCL